MRRGAEIFNEWLGQLLENGLVTLEKMPESFDLMAAQMIDHKLNGFATQLQILGQVVKNDPHWPRKIISELTLMQLATRRLRTWDTETESTKFDLFNVFGINLKKEKLLGNARQKCIWLVIGMTENKVDNLNERKTYLIDEYGQMVMIIDYLFGRQKLKSLVFGQYYEAEMAFYPGSLPLRVVPKQIFRSNTRFKNIANATTLLTDFYKFVQEGLIKNPWIKELPCYLADVVVILRDKQFFIKDKHGGCMNVLIPEQWGRRLSLGCLESPLSLFGVWQKGNLQVLSAHIYGQYFMID